MHSFEFTADLGRIKGKVTWACLIKGLWTETKAWGCGGLEGEGPWRRKGGSLAPRPPFAPGAEARSDGSAPLIQGSARGRDRVRPCTRRHQGQPSHRRLLVTIFGLARRHLGCLAFSCLLEHRGCPESASR